MLTWGKSLHFPSKIFTLLISVLLKTTLSIKCLMQIEVAFNDGWSYIKNLEETKGVAVDHFNSMYNTDNRFSNMVEKCVTTYICYSDVQKLPERLYSSNLPFFFNRVNFRIETTSQHAKPIWTNNVFIEAPVLGQSYCFRFVAKLTLYWETVQTFITNKVNSELCENFKPRNFSKVIV